MQVEHDGVPLGDALERRQEPRRERIGVHRQREGCHGSAVRSDRRERVVLEERELSRQPDHRVAGLGRAHRLRSDQDHATQLVFERPQPLADGGRGDVETAGGGIQGSLVHDGRKRAGEVQGNRHEAMLMVRENPELYLMRWGP